MQNDEKNLAVNKYVYDEISYLKDIVLKTEIGKENRADVSGVLEMMKCADVSDHDFNSESPFEEIVAKYAEREVAKKSAIEYGDWMVKNLEYVKEYEQKYGEGDTYYDTSLNAWGHSIKESLMGDINGIKRIYALDSLGDTYRLSENREKFVKIVQDPDVCIDLLEDAHDDISLAKCPADIDDAVDKWISGLSKAVRQERSDDVSDDLAFKVENARSYNEVFEALYDAEREDILNDGGFVERGYVETRCVDRIRNVDNYEDAIAVLREYRDLDPDAEVYRIANNVYEGFENSSLDEVKEYVLTMIGDLEYESEIDR